MYNNLKTCTGAWQMHKTSIQNATNVAKVNRMFLLFKNSKRLRASSVLTTVRNGHEKPLLLFALTWQGIRWKKGQHTEQHVCLPTFELCASRSSIMHPHEPNMLNSFKHVRAISKDTTWWLWESESTEKRTQKQNMWTTIVLLSYAWMIYICLSYIGLI